MSAAEEVRAEAEQRFPDSGWDESVRTPWRHGFIAGAEWQAPRPITDEQVQAAARAFTLAEKNETSAPITSVRLDYIRAALEAARGAIS